MGIFGDLSNVPRKPTGPLPEGEYDAICIEAKTDKWGEYGKYILTWEIIKHPSYKVRQNITTKGSSAKAVEIGLQHLAALEDAIGEITSLDYPIGKRARIHIGLEPSYKDPTKNFNCFKWIVNDQSVAGAAQQAQSTGAEATDDCDDDEAPF